MINYSGFKNEYHSGKIHIYNGDCMDLLKQTPDKYYDLAIVDPPYGGKDAIDIKDNIGNRLQAAKRTRYKQFRNEPPLSDYFFELKRVSKNQIVWGGNYFGLSGGVIAWNKNGTAFGEGEIAICSTHNSVRFFEYTWNGMLQENMKNKEKRIHPTQKPVALYKWILKNYAKEGDTILDTHFGSLSIGIACHDMGFELTAIELDEDYYEAGKNRLINHQRQLNLF